jgi:hypothetical protein
MSPCQPDFRQRRANSRAETFGGAAREHVRCSDIDFNADDAGNTSDASDAIDGSASRTHAPA